MNETLTQVLICIGSIIINAYVLLHGLATASALLDFAIATLQRNTGYPSAMGNRINPTSARYALMGRIAEHMLLSMIALVISKEAPLRYTLEMFAGTWGALAVLWAITTPQLTNSLSRQVSLAVIGAVPFVIMVVAL